MSSALDRWISTLSRGSLAALAIGVGIIVIIASDPPQTVCDTQISHFKEVQAKFLFPELAKKNYTGASFKQLFSYCEKGNSPGACFEFFNQLRNLLRDLDTLSQECVSQVALVEEVEKALWTGAKFMTKAAWGAQAPLSVSDKNGWLDNSDIALFCQIKSHIEVYYGSSDWESYREKLFVELPGAKNLPRKDTWERILLSTDCRRF